MTTSCSNRTDRTGYSGEDLSKILSIQRDRTSKQTVLTVASPVSWKIYSGPSPNSINLSAPLLEGYEAGEYVLDVPADYRSYFQVVTPKGEALLAEQHLPLEGAFNFRDLGGIRTAEGRYVRWGRIFRSDDLSQLTDYDLTYLNNIPIVSVVDFRSETEIENAPDRLPASVNGDYKFSISPGNLGDLSIENITNLSEQQADSLMMMINEWLVSMPEAVEMTKKFFRLLQDEVNLPLVFHCTAGKDRTGMAAYLFLYSLGVDEETIFNNYLDSNKYLRRKYATYIQAYPALAPLLTVDRRFLEAGAKRIREEHGSVEKYLKDVMKVDIDKMRSIYLYPVR
ncbi:MAG: tyrosine-protein phosphatase [Bacteroides sp.]|nr:tyrosine-protein phosphatase [Bacteroides sp.]